MSTALLYSLLLVYFAIDYWALREDQARQPSGLSRVVMGEYRRLTGIQICAMSLDRIKIDWYFGKAEQSIVR